MLYPHTRTYYVTSWDWNFCSTNQPCDVGEGDCDSDAECKGYLICNQTSAAVDRYGAPSTGDVCAASTRLKSQTLDAPRSEAAPGPGPGSSERVHSGKNHSPSRS